MRACVARTTGNSHGHGHYDRRVTPADLAVSIKDAVLESLFDGNLAKASLPIEVTVERPRSPEHGDYATSVALKLAKGVGRPPREVAALIAREAGGDGG